MITTAKVAIAVLAVATFLWGFVCGVLFTAFSAIPPERRNSERDQPPCT